MSDVSMLPLVVEPAELKQHLGNPSLLVIDVCQPQSYLQGHVPGAVFLPYQQLMSGGFPAPGLLPSEAQLSLLFSALGLTESTHVVAYDDEGGGWAGRLLWTLEMIGHRRYSYLNGGIHAWRDDGMTLETTENRPSPSEYRASVTGSDSVDKAFILGHLDQPDMVVWDARSFEEYAGIRVNAQKGGHIPGACHYEWTQAMDRHRALRIRNLETLRQELADKGIHGDATVVTHCQSHHRSGFTWLLGKVLGFADIRAYPGSWSEWGNAADTPVTVSPDP